MARVSAFCLLMLPTRSSANSKWLVIAHKKTYRFGSIGSNGKNWKELGSMGVGGL